MGEYRLYCFIVQSKTKALRSPVFLDTGSSLLRPRWLPVHNLSGPTLSVRTVPGYCWIAGQFACIDTTALMLYLGLLSAPWACISAVRFSRTLWRP